MGDRPILFSAPMVRAILEDRKNMTRRVVKATTQDFLRIDPLPPACWIDGRPFYGWDGNVGHPLFCPYGQPGDRLWVREAVWLPRPVTNRDLREGADTWPKCIYSADTDETEIAWMREMRWKQRPSIHCPRWASRILLEVTSVRVERVQDISEADALAEGCGFVRPYNPAWSAMDMPREDFRELWDSINAKRGFGWDANPWVWVIEFKRVEGK